MVVHGGGPQIGDLLRPAGQGDRVPRRPAGHRRRDPRHRPDGAGGQGEPGHRLGHQRPRARWPSACRARTPTSSPPGAARPSWATWATWSRWTRPSSTALLAEGLIPVLATIGADAAGQAYNINADAVAGRGGGGPGGREADLLDRRRGAALGPRRPGHPRATRSPRTELDALVAAGAAAGGMVPKAEACSEAVRAGVARAHILDGRVPHALLLELFTDGGVGHDGGADDDGAATARALMRTYAETPVTFVRGEGSRLFDADGPALPRLHLGAGRDLARPLPPGGGRGRGRPGPHPEPRLQPLRQRAGARGGPHHGPADRRGHRAGRGPGVLLQLGGRGQRVRPQAGPPLGRARAATWWSRPGTRSTAGPWPP